MGVFRKVNICLGMKALWIFFGGHHKFGLCLGAISMHFRVFRKVKVKKGRYFFLGCLIFKYFLECLKFLIFSLRECWALAYVSRKNENTPWGTTHAYNAYKYFSEFTPKRPKFSK